MISLILKIMLKEIAPYAIRDYDDDARIIGVREDAPDRIKELFKEFKIQYDKELPPGSLVR